MSNVNALWWDCGWRVPVQAAGAWGALCSPAQRYVAESVIWAEGMCNELRRSVVTVVAFNLPFCLVPEEMKNKWTRLPFRY